MREVRFRAKELRTGEWFYGSLIQHNDGECSIYEFKHWTDDGFPRSDNVVRVDGFTAGEYTGFKDTDGKAIYEDDILSVEVLTNEGYFKYKTDVIFEDGAFWIRGENSREYNTLLRAYIKPTYPIVEIRVVGNLHDNLESQS